MPAKEQIEVLGGSLRSTAIDEWLVDAVGLDFATAAQAQSPYRIEMKPLKGLC